TPLADLDIGALAGTVAQIVSYPFEVVRWRMQAGGLTEPGRRCDVPIHSDRTGATRGPVVQIFASRWFASLR
ncbi:hypothetical protein EDB83DRAFT_2235547, partial [Lactarius deliciosus]